MDKGERDGRRPFIGHLRHHYEGSWEAGSGGRPLKGSLQVVQEVNGALEDMLQFLRYMIISIILNGYVHMVTEGN